MRKSNPNRMGAKVHPAGAHAMRKRVYGPLPEAHPIYATIERVTSEWRHLEHALDIVIWELAAVDRNLGSCITGQLQGYWPRINAITALAAAKAIDSTIIREFELLGSRISKLDKMQKWFFDQVWYSDDGKTSLSIRSSGNEKVCGLNDFTIGKALDLIQLIDAEIIQLWQLQSHLRSGTMPS